jgi:hypothetical protein
VSDEPGEPAFSLLQSICVPSVECFDATQVYQICWHHIGFKNMLEDLKRQVKKQREGLITCDSMICSLRQSVNDE